MTSYRGGLMKLQSLLTRAFHFLKSNHAVVSAVSTVVGTLIATVAIVLTGFALGTQHEANRLVQTQLDISRKVAETQSSQFTAMRQTDLAKIVFDKDSKSALRSYALNELLHLTERGFGKTAYQEDEQKEQWRQAVAEPVSEGRHRKLVKLAQWRCEEFIDMGGGSGTTHRTMLDLRGADLSNADLTNQNLECIDLTGANLTGANLSWAYLSGAILDNVDLTGANLEHLSAYWSVISSPLTLGPALTAELNSLSGWEQAISCVTERGKDDSNMRAGLTGMCPKTDAMRTLKTDASVNKPHR